MAAELSDEPRLTGLMLREALRRLRRASRGPALPFLHRRAREADRLMGVPQDLERGRAAEAEAIYSGIFDLAGHRLVASDRSPFALHDAPLAWREALASFEWLRHLSEVHDALAARNARALVADFLSVRPRRRVAPALQPEIAARRMMALLAHAALVLQDAEPAFQRQFLDALSTEARGLKRMAMETADGLPRLQLRIALMAASLCLPGRQDVPGASARLCAELDRQIFADGGHVSRNPQAIASLLKWLVPLRQLFGARSMPVPRGLFNAVDRMLPAMRFFLHHDGTTALFNGAGVSSVPLVAALVRLDETLGEPVAHMRQSGYHRLSAGGTVLFLDAGLAPPAPLSSQAHAGTLSFEFSSGRQRFVVNCGAPAPSQAAQRRVSRMTAAHSALVVADSSSARFARSPAVDRFLGSPIVCGPTRVPSSREDGPSGQRLLAAHDGYRVGFGLVHERELELSRDGTRLLGVDRLHAAAGRMRPGGLPGAAVRFHLHPDVVLSAAENALRLSAGGEVWWFSCDKVLFVEESIAFAERGSPRPARQIVAVLAPGETQARWRFERQR